MSSVGEYVKKPVVIEAIQVTGNNDAEIAEFIGDAGYDPVDTEPSWIISTLEGEMKARLGWYIIKGVASEFYPCHPDIFQETYENEEDAYWRVQEKIDAAWQSGYDEGHADGYDSGYDNARSDIRNSL